MAKEHRGVLLILLTMLRSTKGRVVVGLKKKFVEQNEKDDWVLLLELFPEWEALLCEPELLVRHVRHSEKKHRHIMCMFWKAVEWQKGVGLKLMKFHGTPHVVEGMLFCGAPSEFDTGANESFHKWGKQAAKLTQMAEDTLHHQTVTRMVEFWMIEHAMHEMETGCAVWQCSDPVHHDVSV